MKSTPLKRKPGPISSKRSSLKKKPPTAEKIEVDKERRDKDLEFYNKIWQSRPHKCVVCGVNLSSEMKTAYMDHLIEKSTHPELRYEPNNIAIVCIDDHGCKTNGFPKAKHQSLIEQAHKQFGV